MKVIPIKSEETTPWLLKKHYAKRLPNIMYAFGLYDEELVGVVTYGIPASPSLCIGVCGKENKDIVLELNRLFINDGIKNGASMLVGNSLSMLPRPRIIVSYAYTAMNHVGYVYQATNFLFTGTTKFRTDMSAGEGKHSRHSNGDIMDRVDRSSKHRYVYFVGDKKQKSMLQNQLRYEIMPYPKGNTKRYDASANVSIQNLLF